MNRYISTIFCLLFLWAVTLQTASAQHRYKNTDESSLPQKYMQLKKGDTLSIRQMLKEGIPVDAIDTRGRTLLMQKALEGDTVCLSFLIKAGADVNKPYRAHNIAEHLYTALDYAIVGKQKETIDLLRRNGALWEEERRKTFSTIQKLNSRIDADMLEYILTKGARFGESEKFDLLVEYVTMPKNTNMQRKIMRICLRDTLEITPEKVQPFIPKWNDMDAQDVCDRMIELQKEEMEDRDHSRRQEQIQDSLKRLMAEGKADTLHYTYSTYPSGEITISPRIDTFYNKVGADKDFLVFLFCALVPFLRMVQLVRKYVKEEWKKQVSELLFPIGMMWFTIGALMYLPVSALYENFDDYYTRLHGREYTAVADYSLEHIKVYTGRTGSRSEIVRRYNFTFVAENGVTTRLNQGRCSFSGYDFTNKGDKLLIRYLPRVQKLSIADASNTSDNLVAMGVNGSILLLMIALLMGKLNFLYKIWIKFRERKSQEKSKHNQKKSKRK